MMAALSVVLMLVSTLIPVLVYVLPIMTGLIVMLVAGMSSKKWALGVYFSTAVLSLILLTDKECALTYALFFGYYPLIRDMFAKLPKALSWALKLLLFNAAAVGIGVFGVLLFGVSGEEYTEFGKLTVPILLGMANIVFLLYEAALTRRGFLVIHLAEKIKKTVNKW